jgi:hypothetical protein
MKLPLALVLILSTGICYGFDDFDIFDSERGKPPPEPVVEKPSKPLPTPFKQSSKPPSRPTPPKIELKPQKDFTLQGTSRIGEKRTVILKGPDNKEFVQRFENNRRTPIKDYEGYYLLSVGAREIQIEYPEDAPCREPNEQKGVLCDDERIATLSLTRRKALPPAKKPKPTKKSSDAERREQARKRREERRKKFQRKVIKDEDVPPGMRVVHTPFGDRLVPIK